MYTNYSRTVLFSSKAFVETSGWHLRQIAGSLRQFGCTILPCMLKKKCIFASAQEPLKSNGLIDYEGSAVSVCQFATQFERKECYLCESHTKMLGSAKVTLPITGKHQKGEHQEELFVTSVTDHLHGAVLTAQTMRDSERLFLPHGKTPLKNTETL